ncbi:MULTISPECIES: hypothetical protein [Arthrobacter]|uniref:Uncharacterized protein n=1 Tax=Arthrobacter terricola TaxID=2547396 RepID=A0A4R5KBW7_9MICC|nr:MULTISPECIES: hypothetical protein [Arthrobacter]MBT8163232.1 hypothetical protein [Arthrobacter sp. GN70]TDF91510.1 hypothetical protein E1809_20495 [Arthrobacter terricola]
MPDHPGHNGGWEDVPMEVLLAIGPMTGPDESDDPAQHRQVTAEDEDYETALARARGLVPEGFRVLHIRTDR